MEKKLLISLNNSAAVNAIDYDTPVLSVNVGRIPEDKQFD